LPVAQAKGIKYLIFAISWGRMICDLSNNNGSQKRINDKNRSVNSYPSIRRAIVQIKTVFQMFWGTVLLIIKYQRVFDEKNGGKDGIHL
jgi:hypothetical protein